MLRNRAKVLIALALVALTGGAAALAQYGQKALVAPGETVPAQLLTTQGGAAGQELAGFVGRRPVFLVYWRPKDPVSEANLASAADVQQAAAPGAAFFPVAVLAASQSPDDVANRLAALGLASVPPRLDGSGQLATILGIRSAPAFALIDAGGVLRLAGGSDLTQTGPNGVSIAEAVALAGRGAPVPTLGVLQPQPVYRLIGKPLPDAAVTELDGRTWRKLSAYAVKGKRLVVFAWLPTCPHCKTELPRLRDWYLKNRPADLAILDIARAESPALQEDARKIIADYPWTHLLDVDRSALRSLMVTETPSIYLVGADGTIQGIQVGGPVNWDAWLGGGKQAASGAR
jgi:thiol-disulfide isomerase/thioredoxin